MQSRAPSFTGIFPCSIYFALRRKIIVHIPSQQFINQFNSGKIYIEGEYGVRIENVQLVVDAGIMDAGIAFYEFETLTMVPIDIKLVEPSLMSGDELAWLNTYHAKVHAALAPNLEGEALQWLESATREIGHDA